MTSEASLLAEFVARATPPPAARARGAAAIRDTLGVMLAGATEPAARLVQAMAADEGRGPCVIVGTPARTGASWAALANGVVAAQLARRGYTASERSLDGPQGFLAGMDAEHTTLERAVANLDSHWEILTTGITVKLYPSCAATHPTIDVLRDLRRREGIAAHEVEAIEVEVDSMTPRLLIYDRPATGLEGKFSMPFCAAAAIVDGDVGIGTFDPERIQAPAIQTLLPKVTMLVDPAFDREAPLSHTRVTVRLRGGRVLTASAAGARGYPARPASEEELAAKFAACARRSLPSDGAARAWTALADIERIADVSTLADLMTPVAASVS